MALAAAPTKGALGSSCLDFHRHGRHRSFEIDDEITLGVLDASLARQLEAVFEHDLADCVEIELAAWRARGRWHRLEDHAFYFFNEQL